MNHDSYSRMRAQGVSALNAWQYANQVVPTLPWNSGMATWSEQGFDLQAIIKEDEYPDLTYLGKFTNEWSAGALRHEHLNSRTLDWFVPMITEDEHFEEMRKLHYGRSLAHELARSYVHQDYQRARSYGTQWATHGIIVTARRAGISLGEATVWGIEDDANNDYLTEVTRDLAADALSQAQDAVERLCGASAAAH